VFFILPIGITFYFTRDTEKVEKIIKDVQIVQMAMDFIEIVSLHG